MANPDWGTKRVCLSCSARFYDLNKRPIVCPECEEAFAPEAFQKGRGRRSQAATQTVAAAKPVAVKAPEPVAAASDEQAEEAEIPDIQVDVEVEDDDEDEDSIIEDASELGGDDDDVAEVIDGVGDEKES